MLYLEQQTQQTADKGECAQHSWPATARCEGAPPPPELLQKDLQNHEPGTTQSSTWETAAQTGSSRSQALMSLIQVESVLDRYSNVKPGRTSSFLVKHTPGVQPSLVGLVSECKNSTERRATKAGREKYAETRCR